MQSTIMQSTMQQVSASHYEFSIEAIAQPCLGNENPSYNIAFHYSSQTVVCTFAQFQYLCQDQTNVCLCALYKLVCQRISQGLLKIRIVCEGVFEELKCFALISKAALEHVFCAIAHCLEHGWDSCKAWIECTCDKLKDTAAELYLQIVVAFKCLKIKAMAIVTQVKLAAHWSVMKLHELCHFFGCVVDYTHEALCDIVDQIKTYLKLAACATLEGLLRVKAFIKRAFHKLVKVIKRAGHDLKARLHKVFHGIEVHFDACVSKTRLDCFKVIAPCMPKAVLAKLVMCNSAFKTECYPIMWANVKLSTRLCKKEKVSKRLGCYVQTAELHQHTSKIIVSEVDVHNHVLVQATNQLFGAMSHGACPALAPHTLQFGERTVIRSEWAQYINKMSCVKNIQCSIPPTPEVAQCFRPDAYSLLSVKYESYKSVSYQHSAHIETLRIVINQRNEAVLRDYTCPSDNALVVQRPHELVLGYEQLRVESSLQIQVREYHNEVFAFVQGKGLMHLKHYEYEIVEKGTRKVTRVICPALPIKC